ncbi:MAG: phytoene desaturase [Cyclobacteriaceae bacterium]|jgi:phytoene desaturase
MVTPSERNNVAIIGAGIAGIATAIRLAVRGYHVDIYEANSYPGGKLSEFRLDGYRFDAGPSLFTLPGLVEDLFALCDEKTEEHFVYHKLDKLCEYFYEDGTAITAFSDKAKLIEELHKKTDEPRENIQKALDNSATLHKYLGELFMSRSLHDYRTFINGTAFKAYVKIHKLDFFRTMNRANESMFENEKLVQLFNRYATYNGSNPYKTPATMNIIPHLEYGVGAFFPAKGMNDITQSLVSLAERRGVTFHYNTPIEQIILTGKSVTGIKINGVNHDYSRVVSNMDIVGTYTRLLPQLPEPTKLLNQPKSSSALIFYWGIKQTFEQLDLHNIFFSRDYKKEFAAIFDEQTVSDDPTVYINITSKYKKDDAPHGCENWFTMINVPNNQGQDWDQLIAQARASIQTKINRMLGINLAELIEVEEILDPRLIESKTSSSFGALYGNSSNNKFAAFLRHANFSKKIKGLYFCGGSVHPGGGIPMCLSSAKIVDRYFS